MSMFDPVVIVSATRTPIGSFLGELREVSATTLGAVVLQAALQRAGIPGDAVDEIVMGCVLQAGLGQAPARQAALRAGLPASVVCSTVNKMCGSGMKAVMSAYDLLVADSARVVLAGGMESMSNAPYLLERARSGYRLGHGKLVDHMYFDGLEDAYDRGQLMGRFADTFAQTEYLSREQQDAFAITSLQRAQAASASGTFDAEITPVTYQTRQGVVTVRNDEQPGKAREDKIASLKPAFTETGTVTAANASSISDGSAALLLMRLSEARRRRLHPLARIAAHASTAQEPSQFCSAPIGAINKVLERAQWSQGAVDLFEINEAFAVVPMAAMRELSIDHEHVNIHGGACALGHPIGASGARIIVTLIHALQRQNLIRGVATACIGGGEATAIAIELLE